MICGSRLLQVVLFVLSLVAVWFYLPVWLPPMGYAWRGFFAWLGGSFLFLFVLLFIYAIECVLRQEARQ